MVATEPVPSLRLEFLSSCHRFIIGPCNSLVLCLCTYHCRRQHFQVRSIICASWLTDESILNELIQFSIQMVGNVGSFRYSRCHAFFLVRLHIAVGNLRNSWSSILVRIMSKSQIELVMSSTRVKCTDDS